MFKVGEMVTRTGDDAWLVVEVSYEIAIRVMCVMTQPEDRRWAEVGDEEFNLARRYELKDANA